MTQVLFNPVNSTVLLVVNTSARTFATLAQAVIEIISNPVNSTVPIASEVLKAAGVYDPKRLLGVTTLDVVSHRVTHAQR